jgi:Protein of unknown function DUF262
MSLQDEIDSSRQKIQTDGYRMSIGELVNMYRDGELIIDPAYQRLFRWTEHQKAQLVDSILLGIPLPSIFVSQKDNGVWELVDGLQRISTILQLLGILNDADGKPVAKLTLIGTKHLPSLMGKSWSEDEADPNALDSSQRLLIKRTKLEVQIVKKESDASSKYELFQRLNTLGSRLSPMEIRNCLLIMIDPTFAEWIKKLADDPNFIACVDQTDRAKDELADREMVCRFLVFRTIAADKLNLIDTVDEFIDEIMVSFANDPKYDRAVEEAAFRQTFEILTAAGGPEVFRRYNATTGKHGGMFLVSAYEVIATGLGNREPGWKPADLNAITQTAKDLWSNPSFTGNSGAGVRASTRVKTTIPLGRNLFAAL